MVSLLPVEQEHLSLPLPALLRLDVEIPAGTVAMRPLNQAHVQQLAGSDMARWPEIVVAHCTEGYLVVDGNHRWRAAQLKQAETIRARCQAFTEERQIIDAAFRANLVHGLQASPSTRGAYACWLHATFPALTQEQIAKLTCLTQGAVSKALAKEAKQQEATASGDPATQATRRFLTAALRFVEIVEPCSDEELCEAITDQDRAKLARLVRLLAPPPIGTNLFRRPQFLSSHTQAGQSGALLEHH